MNFSKSLVAEIILHSTLGLSEEFLPLVSFSVKLFYFLWVMMSLILHSCLSLLWFFYFYFSFHFGGVLVVVSFLTARDSLLPRLFWQNDKMLVAALQKLLKLSVVAIKGSSTSKGDMDFTVSLRTWINYSPVLKKVLYLK